MFLRRKQPGPLGWKIHKILTWIAIPSLNLAFEVVIIIYLCGNFYVSGCLGLEVTICWKSTVRKPTVDWKIVKNQAFDRFSRNLLYWKCWLLCWFVTIFYFQFASVWKRHIFENCQQLTLFKKIVKTLFVTWLGHNLQDFSPWFLALFAPIFLFLTTSV